MKIVMIIITLILIIITNLIMTKEERSPKTLTEIKQVKILK